MNTKVGDVVKIKVQCADLKSSYGIVKHIEEDLCDVIVCSRDEYPNTYVRSFFETSLEAIQLDNIDVSVLDTSDEWVKPMTFVRGDIVRLKHSNNYGCVMGNIPSRSAFYDVIICERGRILVQSISAQSLELVDVGLSRPVAFAVYSKLLVSRFLI